MSRTVVHLLRHGEVHNPAQVLYGRLPGYHLSERGQAQVAAVEAALGDADLACVLSSPLERAQQTAAPIAAAHGLTVITDERLVEAGNSFEGLGVGVGDGVLRRPAYWWRLRNPFRPSWGEPYQVIADRMLEVVLESARKASGREAVLVSHQLPIWTLRRRLTGQRLWHDPRRRQCALASLTSVSFDGDTVLGVSYREPAGASDPTVTGA
jgi:broad specificity phosphatase PhoE